ncbi:hypothetical protein Vau01_122110 [Virgisporangium aurantiacum]|uniref:Uncharacterized protein n=1 Tax=Virgisporangium aurantiacum TaxID=175570 RepID=A0A8J3ZMI2_9ACTN|nr:hypothetical protein Vau01_122110 [Virgisporangium aurantiacum]
MDVLFGFDQPAGESVHDAEMAVGTAFAAAHTGPADRLQAAQQAAQRIVEAVEGW